MTQKEEEHITDDFIDETEDINNESAKFTKFLGHFSTKLTAQRGVILPEAILKVIRAWDADSVIIWRESISTVSIMTSQQADEIESKYKNAIMQKLNDPEYRDERAEIRKFYRMILAGRHMASISVNGKITLSKDMIENLKLKAGEHLHMVGMGSRLLLMNSKIYEQNYGSEAERKYYKYQNLFKDISLELPDDFIATSE
ncbi:MAG: hypothetical protein K8S87_10775 [Planctomycetes bacterium]|nr:hypothetical protein [Planctomycetota bacterium]